MFIGILIGLVKVVFKDAWLTVLDGYRPGRELILSEARTVLGRAEYAALSFMGRTDAPLALEHALILRQPDGRFALEDNKTQEGTRVNNVRITSRVLLNNGDVIRIGTNSIKFSERHRRAGEAAKVAPQKLEVPPSKLEVPPPRPVDGPLAKPAFAPVAQPRPVDGPLAKPPVATAAKPAVATPPAPAPTSQSTPARPAPAAPPAAPAPAPDGSSLCPSCQKPVPKGQRYCIRCDLYF
jgi:hypothetical protein